MQADYLQERRLHEDGTKPRLQSLFGNGAQPLFYGAQSTWAALEHHGEIASCDRGHAFKCVGQALQFDRVHHWVFVPSYNRFDTTRKDQALLDWSDAAINSNTCRPAGFVRVIVVRPEERQTKVLDLFTSSHECHFAAGASCHQTVYIDLLLACTWEHLLFKVA